MSFEGFYQVICENGHYHIFDCYEYKRHAARCTAKIDGKTCEAPIKWDNLVDDTNGDQAGLVDVVELSKAEIRRRCDLGCSYVWNSATYAPMPMGPLGLLADQAKDDPEPLP